MGAAHWGGDSASITRNLAILLNINEQLRYDREMAESNVTITREFARDVLAALTALPTFVQAHADFATPSMLISLMDANELVDDLFVLGWGRYPDASDDFRDRNM